MNKTRMVKRVLGILFFSISIRYFLYFIEFRSIISESKPISYLFVNQRVRRGGRGSTYEMDYKYGTINGTVNITSEEYGLIENEIYPKLYYSKRFSKIYSGWEVKKAIRITVLFFSLSIIALFPWNKLFLRKSH